jgi:dTDP-4-dehydrorhamnose reductase
MEKILVTGSNGLLGQKLTDLYLKRSDRQLIATSTGSNRHPVKAGYVYEEMDITDELQVRDVIEKHRPTALIHTAAMTNVDTCETEHDLCMDLNVHSVELLANLSQEFRFRMMLLSTDFIFDGTGKMYKEGDIPNPLSFYGRSKLMAEEIMVRRAYHWSILRTVLVYGTAANLTRSNIVLWVYETLKAQNAAKVVDDQFRTPTLAEDLAMGCMLAEEKQVRGIFNIAGKDFMSMYELVERIAAHFNFSTASVERIKSDTLNQAAKRPPVTGLDITKAREILGYEPHSFEEGLDITGAQLGW